MVLLEGPMACSRDIEAGAEAGPATGSRSLASQSALAGQRPAGAPGLTSSSPVHLQLGALTHMWI